MSTQQETKIIEALGLSNGSWTQLKKSDLNKSLKAVLIGTNMFAHPSILPSTLIVAVFSENYRFGLCGSDRIVPLNVEMYVHESIAKEVEDRTFKTYTKSDGETDQQVLDRIYAEVCGIKPVVSNQLPVPVIETVVTNQTINTQTAAVMTNQTIDTQVTAVNQTAAINQTLDAQTIVVNQTEANDTAAAATKVQVRARYSDLIKKSTNSFVEKQVDRVMATIQKDADEGHLVLGMRHDLIDGCLGLNQANAASIKQLFSEYFPSEDILIQPLAHTSLSSVTLRISAVNEQI